MKDAPSTARKPSGLRALRKFHEDAARKSGGILWRWAHEQTAAALRARSRRVAVRRLRALERDFAHMSLSCIFSGAANSLTGTP